MTLTTLDLFSGVGGFALGLEATDFFETSCFVENEPYCQAVLRHHWPAWLMGYPTEYLNSVPWETPSPGKSGKR